MSKDLNTKDNIEEIKKILQNREMAEVARSLKMSPSKKLIYNLNKEVLLKHNALIFHKGSSLSSTQRKMIQQRIGYGLNKGTIKPEEVAREVNKLNALIQGELTKAIQNDGSSINK